LLMPLTSRLVPPVTVMLVPVLVFTNPPPARVVRDKFAPHSPFRG
jgi:hypothetical protein